MVPFPHPFKIGIAVFFFFFGVRSWTQHLVLASLALVPLSYVPGPGTAILKALREELLLSSLWKAAWKRKRRVFQADEQCMCWLWGRRQDFFEILEGNKEQEVEWKADTKWQASPNILRCVCCLLRAMKNHWEILNKWEVRLDFYWK